MKKLFLIQIFIFVFSVKALCYETNVHRKITDQAISSSNISLYLKNNLNIKLNDYFRNRKAQEWIEEGSKLEDTAPRWLKHFYDPTTEKGLNTGGIVILGDPSMQWGKNSLLNSWDWKDARDYYYSALTSVDRNTRENAFANTFRALGQVIHLIQDKAVPSHTRNDAHNFSNKQLDMYEIFTRDSGNGIQGLPPLVYDGYNEVDPITFNSFNTFWKNNGKGLAEYSNRNFLSRDTNIDDNVYALPAATGSWTTMETVRDMDSGNMTDVEVKYLKGYASDSYRPDLSAPVNRLSAYSYFDYDMNKNNKTQKVYSLNNSVHKEYSDLLIPRAVGYSAGLLDYFFRGNIDIIPPGSGIYAQTNNAAAGFTQIKLRARNVSANNEQMNGGTIKLVVGYRRAIDDPFKNYPPTYAFQAENEITYIAASEINDISVIPSDGYIELTFNLSGNPLPVRTINVFVRLVYQGRLGSEDGAVVVGFKDISEPTPIDLFNDMDQICLNGVMYPAGSAGAIDQVDTNNNGIPTWDVYPHDLSDIYYKASSKTDPHYASESNADVAVPVLHAGNYVRALYIMTDYDFSYNAYQTLARTVQEDPWMNSSWRTPVYDGIAIKNQAEYEEDPDICAPLSAPCSIWWYPTFLEYRGATLWWGGGIMYTNRAYHEGSECDCYQGVLRNCMSETQTLKTTDSKSGIKVLRKDSVTEAATSDNAQMLPLTHKQRKMPMER